jgi:hypothetical protein
LGIGIVSIALGAIGLVIGRPAWSRVFVVGEVATQGRVVRLEDMGRRGKVPVVQYEVERRRYEVTGDPNWRRPGGYAVGESVTVRYSPRTPGRGSIDVWWGRWLPALLFGGGGSLLLVFGAILAWPRRR